MQKLLPFEALRKHRNISSVTGIIVNFEITQEIKRDVYLKGVASDWNFFP